MSAFVGEPEGLKVTGGLTVHGAAFDIVPGRKRVFQDPGAVSGETERPEAVEEQELEVFVPEGFKGFQLAQVAEYGGKRDWTIMEAEADGPIWRVTLHRTNVRRNRRRGSRR